MSILILMVLIVLIFDFTNGFHDTANVVAAPIATGVISTKKGILLAAIFNLMGAMQISGVAQTMTTGIVHLDGLSEITVIIATSAAILWNIITWYFAIPSSSSYALIGGLMGSSFVKGGLKVILWKSILYKVILPMLLAPFVGALFGALVMYALMKIQQRNHSFYQKAQIGSLMLMAFSHGLNDTQKSMGIITMGLVAAKVLSFPVIPIWVVGACALTMALGTAAGGIKIIQTVGYGITTLHPKDGCASQLGASLVVLGASFLGIPLSSTQIMTGSIAGITLMNQEGLQWKTLYKMVIIWILTLPGAAGVAAIFSRVFSCLTS
ncbi:MAG: inorganic phosphate transporter [Candidatus Rhabdochlamydia sp.]